MRRPQHRLRDWIQSRLQSHPKHRDPTCALDLCITIGGLEKMMTNALSLSRQSLSVLMIAAGTLLASTSPAHAQLKLIISGGFSTALQQVLPEFERSTGITVITLSGASQGKGPETIAAQLSRGVPADVAILSREGLAELIA